VAVLRPVRVSSDRIRALLTLAAALAIVFAIMAAVVCLAVCR
jgi:hypothetical protein